MISRLSHRDTRLEPSKTRLISAADTPRTVLAWKIFDTRRNRRERRTG